MQQRSCKTSVT